MSIVGTKRLVKLPVCSYELLHKPTNRHLAIGVSLIGRVGIIDPTRDVRKVSPVVPRVHRVLSEKMARDKRRRETAPRRGPHRGWRAQNRSLILLWQLDRGKRFARSMK